MAVITSGVPAVDYTSKDYAGFLSSMLTFATSAFPEWTNQNPGSLEVMILESLARELDVLSYYGDRIVAESYIGTATQLSSVIQLATLLGYTPGQPVASTGTVTFTSSASGTTSIPLATQVTTNFISNINGPIIFETQLAQTVTTGGSVTVAVAQGVTQGNSVFTLGNSTLTPFQVTTELIGTSDGSALQVFTLANNPVISGSITVYVQNPSYPGTSGVDPVLPWNLVPSLQAAVSSSYSWAETVDAQGVVSVNFGDNTNGAIPAAGLNIYANYRVGGGIIGNLASNQIVDVASPIAGLSITSSSAMTGGTDAETIDQIRVNAPRAYTTQQRAVTLSDFGNLAMSLPAVSQASAVANTYTSITVYVIGAGSTVPSQSILDSVTTFLQPLSLAGTIVTSTAGSLIPINIGSSGSPVVISCSTRYSPTSIQILATQAVQGLFAPSNVTLGGRVSLNSIYAVLSAIPGVQYVNIPLMARNDAAQSGATDILLRTNELPTAGTIVINVTAAN